MSPLRAGGSIRPDPKPRGSLCRAGMQQDLHLFRQTSKVQDKSLASSTPPLTQHSGCDPKHPGTTIPAGLEQTLCKWSSEDVPRSGLRGRHRTAWLCSLVLPPLSVTGLISASVLSLFLCKICKFLFRKIKNFSSRWDGMKMLLLSQGS